MKGRIDMKTVLLTNGQQRKTLAVVRSLGKRNIKVIVAEETRFNPSAFSKYCSKVLVCPSARKEPDKYYSWLCRVLSTYKCDVMFPMDDDVFEIVMKNSEELLKICSIVLPNMQSYLLSCDKSNATKLAEEVGVPCPQTLHPKNLYNLLSLIEPMKFPLVIKPRVSSGSRGIRIVNNKEEFIKVYEEIHQVYGFPIIQEYIGIGDRYDVCLLFDNANELKAQFVQKEIRHFPIDIGPSTMQESVEAPEVLQYALSIMKKLPWKGVVELEFIVDTRDNKFKFMEINPRFWGSLQLAITAGVDFPWMLYKLSVERKVEETSKYKTGCMCSWLLPGDILHFIGNKDRKKMKPPFLAGEKYGVQDDIVSKKDPLPVLGFILACFRYLFDKNMWKLIFKR
ncbi:MAG TPA: ATP-grasp domain-containing protein [Clostridium sp.]